MDRKDVMSWVRRYEELWRSPGVSRLSEVFSDGATYCTAPFERPFRGLNEIAPMWEATRSGPNEHFVMTPELVAVEGSTAVIRVEVRYASNGGQTYRDLWITEFDDLGRCIAFEEWPFWPPESAGTYTRNPG